MKNTKESFTPVVLRILAAGFALTTLAAPFAAHASGTRIGFKDAFAMGRGNAFAATADNASAVYYNPAGLTQLSGQQLLATGYAISIESEYRGAGGTASMDDDYNFLPQVFYSFKPSDSRWAYGAGFYVPFGLATEWAPDSPLRTFALKNEQTCLTFNLSAAYELTPTLSIGGGLTYNRVSTEIRRAIGVFGPNDLFRFKGDGDAVGYTLGVLWQPKTEHSFGVSYQSNLRVKMDGTTDTIPLITGESSKATFEFPEVLVLGYSYRPTPAWNFEVNVDWTNWNRFNTVTIEKGSGPTLLPFNWESSFFYEFGATRYFANHWNVSAGYLFSENSGPNSTFLPAVPDTDYHFYSLGLGYNSGNITVNLAWHYADGGTRTVTGSPPSLIGATADGTYKNTVNAIALSFGLSF